MEKKKKKKGSEGVRTEALEQDVCHGEIPRKADEVDFRPSRRRRCPPVGPARVPAVRWTPLIVTSLSEEL